MRRITDIDHDVIVRVIAWLDENGEVTTNEDELVDLHIRVEMTGEDCVISYAQVREMESTGHAFNARVH